MALITCPECKREKSSTADVCPSCGYKVARSSAGGFLVALIVLSGALTYVLGPVWGIGFFALFGIGGSVALILRR